MNTLYDPFADYISKRQKEAAQRDIQGRKLAREILALTMDLGQVLPYDVISGFHGGTVNQVNCTVYDTDDKHLFNEYVYFDSNLCDLPKLKRFKASLERAIKFKEVPKALD